MDTHRGYDDTRRKVRAVLYLLGDVIYTLQQEHAPLSPPWSEILTVAECCETMLLDLARSYDAACVFVPKEKGQQSLPLTDLEQSALEFPDVWQALKQGPGRPGPGPGPGPSSASR